MSKTPKAKKTGAVRVDGKRKIKLSQISPDATGAYREKEETLERLDALRARLIELQEALYAERRRSVLIVLQAMDTGGKDGALRRIMSGVNAAGVQVTSFKAPSAEELDHDFLWRAHHRVPGCGMIGVWNRSHYEDVLIVRVHKLAPRKVWTARYDDINTFEAMLHHNNVTVLKFFLHISKDEQKERLQARLDDPAKNWKFSPGDLEERKYWDDYQAAFEAAINRCSTPHAPWIVVPANHKWGRDIAIAEAVVEALEKLDPQFPKPDFDPAAIVID